MAASGGPTPRTPWATAHQRWAVLMKSAEISWQREVTAASRS